MANEPQTLDLVSKYLPDLEALHPEHLERARLQVYEYLQTQHPDVDFSPATPAGDLILQPMVTAVAAMEVAGGRILSDLDLGNVASGVQWNCEFLAQYLGNFSVYGGSGTEAHGVVRLVFSESKELEWDRGTRFNFDRGSQDVYSVRLPSDLLPIKILPAGYPADASMNEFVMTQTGLSSWTVELPLVGDMTEPVESGASGSINLQEPSLVGIVAAVSFGDGLPPTSITELAKRTRETSHALTCNTRNGIVRGVKHFWPETKVASAVIPGDSEYVLPGGIAGPLQKPGADIVYHSVHKGQRETQQIKLPRGTGTNFDGVMDLLHNPIHIESIQLVDDASLPLAVTISKVVGDSTTNLHDGFSSREVLEVTVDETDPELPIPTRVDDDGIYQLFEVTYICDPVAKHVQAYYDSSDNGPVGMSVNLYSGCLIRLDTLTINYRVTPGTKFYRTNAVREIAAYINSAGYPNEFSEGVIHEILHFAGASAVQSVSYGGTLRATVADQLVNRSTSPEIIDLSLGAIHTISSREDMTAIRGFNREAGDLETSNLFRIAGPRNIHYLINESDIVLNEL